MILYIFYLHVRITYGNNFPCSSISYKHKIAGLIFAPILFLSFRMHTFFKCIFMPSKSKIGGHIVMICLSFYPPIWNFNLATGITFERWVLARALIIHMSIPCEKTFHWLHVSLFWTLWPWPWSLTHSLKILNLLMTFEQWVLELSYCTWTLLILLVSRYLSLWPWQSLELAIIGGICVSQTHLVGN